MDGWKNLENNMGILENSKQNNTQQRCDSQIQKGVRIFLFIWKI